MFTPYFEYYNTRINFAFDWDEIKLNSLEIVMFGVVRETQQMLGFNESFEIRNTN